MVQSSDDSSLSRSELVVLACLSQSRPPSDDELGAAVQQLALPKESAEAARRRGLELLVGLVRRALVTDDGESPRRGKQRKPPPPRTLTDGGKRALRDAFRLQRTPTWAQVRDKYLPALALGVPPGPELAKQACTETALTAAVLSARFGVRGASTPMEVCDAMIASALKMPEGKLTLDRIRAHVLLRGIDRQVSGIPAPSSKGYASKVAAWISCTAVGAGESPRKMGRALARRWVCRDASPLGGSSVGPIGDPSPLAPVGVVVPPPPPAQNLLEVVRDTIPRIGAEGRFGEKVYVSAIWRRIEYDRKVGDLSLDYFKRWLVGANRDGWLVLARADLVGAMDVKQVHESEIQDRGATFHFVLDPRNGASVAQRESHAG